MWHNNQSHTLAWRKLHWNYLTPHQIKIIKQNRPCVVLDQKRLLKWQALYSEIGNCRHKWTRRQLPHLSNAGGLTSETSRMTVTYYCTCPTHRHPDLIHNATDQCGESIHLRDNLIWKTNRTSESRNESDCRRASCSHPIFWHLIEGRTNQQFEKIDSHRLSPKRPVWTKAYRTA